MHKQLFMALLLFAPRAWAEEPLTDFMVTEHPLASDVDLTAGTVRFASGTGAVFAGPAATYVVSMKKGRATVKKVGGHPAQSHHKDAVAIALNDGGAIVLLSDDRRRLQIARFDAKSGQWLSIERPIGLVPRGSAVIGDFVVFPQATRSPAWFVFDAKTNSFDRAARPDGVAACAGTTFAHGGAALVAGVDVDNAACTVSFNPKTKAWRTLPPPPAAPGDLVVGDRSKTHLVGAAQTLIWEQGTWKVSPQLPNVGPSHNLAATKRGVVAWKLGAGGLVESLLSPKGAVTAVTEPLDFSNASAVPIGATTWLVAAKQLGRPVLLELNYDPTTTADARAKNREKLVAAPADTNVDWKTASEADQRVALTNGLGAVERYVPPELDDKGKVKTKGAWVFALGEQLVVWPVPPKSCKKFIEKMVAKWPTDSVGSTWKTERGPGFARSGKQLLYSPAGQCRETQKCATDYFSQRAIPLSQVGPVFSYSEHTSEASNCGESTNKERWHAVDLRTNKPAELTAVIEPESVLAALKAHKITGTWVADSETLDAALVALRAKDPTGFVGFAFGGWRSMTRRVELRLEYHPGGPDMVEPIKIWVEPRAEFVETFESAARTKGLFMGSSD